MKLINQQVPSTKEIFHRFNRLYQKSWNDQFKNRSLAAALMAQWETIFRQMTPEAIRLALNFLQSPDNTDYIRFPPRPLEFLQLPRQIREKHLPSETACYEAALMGRWEFHPIVKPSAQACGLYWLHHQATDAQGRERFAKTYADVVKRFLAGKPLQELPALPASTTNNTINDRASTQPRKYPLSWAEKIVRHSNRMLALPSALEKIRAAKTAKEKLAVCFELSKQVKATDPNSL